MQFRPGIAHQFDLLLVDFWWAMPTLRCGVVLMIEEWQQLDVYMPEQLYALAGKVEEYVDQIQVRGI